MVKDVPVPPNCASCELETLDRICMSSEGSASKGCPTVTRQQTLEEANQEYLIPETREFARQASIQEGECYANRHQRPYVMQPTKTRIQEVWEFALKMGYKRLGLAFCIGLAKEADIVKDILALRGFEVISAVCKAGRTSKTFIGLKEEEKIFQGMDEAMCNPIFQARLLNSEQTEFNLLLGLCVGHDSLFFKYTEAPTTVLAVKDRVTGHNPLVPVYLSDTFYRKIRNPQF
jgi:uncharacterized metal-binding protein